MMRARPADHVLDLVVREKERRVLCHRAYHRGGQTLGRVPKQTKKAKKAQQKERCEGWGVRTR
jgi:hypothetical protein